MVWDIVIIGSGIIGSTIARELSRYQTNILVVDKENDVACGTTKANSGIVHAGYDAPIGSLKAKYNILGNKMFDQLSLELDFPFIRNGSMVLAYNDEEKRRLEKLYQVGQINQIENLQIILGERARSKEPYLSNNVVAALYAPSAGIVSPYEMAIAFAENAATNGVKFLFNFSVKEITKRTGGFAIFAFDNRIIQTKIIINCAGVYADYINNLINNEKISIVPRKGEYILLDRDKTYTNTTLFTLPTKMGKGVLIAPTIHGNTIVGPTAIDIVDKEDLSTTLDGLNNVWTSGINMIPSLNQKMIITAFTGLRAHMENNDFLIGFSPLPEFYNVAGIASPGLTSSPAIANKVTSDIVSYLNLIKKTNFVNTRKAISRFRLLSNQECDQLSQKDHRFANIVCRCENVTEGEIVEAIHRNPGAKDLDGIKRRTHCGMGRCQGGFCTPKVMKILARELNIPLTAITKKGENSYLVKKRTY